MKIACRCALILILTGLLGGGCAHKKKPPQPVTGKLLVDNRPAKGATVTLIPVNSDDPKSIKPTGTVQEDGSFRLTSYKADDGAPEGEYVVLIDWTEVDPKTKGERPLVAGKYADPTQSEIRVTIKAGANELAPISIASVAAMPLPTSSRRRGE